MVLYFGQLRFGINLETQFVLIQHQSVVSLIDIDSHIVLRVNGGNHIFERRAIPGVVPERQQRADEC